MRNDPTAQEPNLLVPRDFCDDTSPKKMFYLSGEVDHFVRFCFCKKDALLDQAIERLAKAFR